MTALATDLFLLVAAYGLALSVSYAGLPMLGQGAFVSVGAFGTALLVEHAWPLGVAVIASVCIASGAGYLVGFAAARLDGAPLALATWGLAWLGYLALLVFPALSGGSAGLTMNVPARLVSPALGLVITLRPWLLAVLAAVVCALLAGALRRAEVGPWGLDSAALRSGPAVADALGVPVQRRRRAVLAATAAIGALGGAGTAVLVGVVAPADYSPLLSVQLFVAVLVGGTATWWGPALGVALLAALPSTADAIATSTGADPLRTRGVLTAALLVAALLLRRPVSTYLAPRLRPARPGLPEPVPTPAVAMSETLVEVRAVSAAYGAVQVLDRVDLELRRGEVHALIGPNGSGKSTVLRVVTGVLTPSAGEVRIAERPAPRAGTAAPRVHAGVARTPQRTVPFGDLDAVTQAEIGARARDRDRFAALRHLFGTPSAQAATRRRGLRAADALTRVGLGARALTPSPSLDSAEQRLVQVARTAATGAPALLLDEPAAGMSAEQRDRLADTLRSLAAAGNGVFLVEHDMRLVARAADRVSVLVDGRVIASGAPDEIRRDPAVAAAYLGTSP